jgi:hypothetical protein
MLRLRWIVFQAGFFGFQKVVCLFNEFVQFLWVLLDRGLLAQHFPAFFVRTLHWYTPRDSVTYSLRLVCSMRHIRRPLPEGPDCLFDFLLVRYRTYGALQRFGCHPFEVTDVEMDSHLFEVRNRI